MRTSARSSPFVEVSCWRWTAVFVASAGMMIVGARPAALAQRAELAEPEFEKRVNNTARHCDGITKRDTSGNVLA